MSYSATIKKIAETVPKKDLYIMLAEEATELAQAALKAVRYESTTIPTPKPLIEILNNIQEEFSDLITVTDTLNLWADEDMTEEKADRWLYRIEEAKKRDDGRIQEDRGSAGND